MVDPVDSDQLEAYLASPEYLEVVATTRSNRAYRYDGDEVREALADRPELPLRPGESGDRRPCE